MERKVITLMCVCSCMIMVACGDSSTISEANSVQENSEKSTSFVNQDFEQQNQALEGNGKEELKFEICNFGDMITTDFVEFTIETASILENLYPTDTSSSYSYIEGKDGEHFFCLIGTIKNIGGNAYDVKDMRIEMMFDNKYTYTGYVAADDGGRNFYGNNVKPLSTIKYYIYSSIPDELINSYSTCIIKFAFKENFEHELFTDFSLYDYRYQIELEKSDIDQIDSLDGDFLAEVFEKYPEYVNELSDYVTSIHKQDFLNGKSFSDFDDYNEYFDDFYNWANEIIDYKGNVPNEYQELWNDFQSLIIYHVDILEESYDKDSKEALTLISKLMNYISDRSKAISQQIKNFK